MWRPPRRKLSWRSALFLTLAFLPVAVLVGYIPGSWWWIGAGLAGVAFFTAMWVVAGRDERKRAARFVKPS
jgi:4-hydroxybenzoate polyprenyltransferase